MDTLVDASAVLDPAPEHTDAIIIIVYVVFHINPACRVHPLLAVL